MPVLELLGSRIKSLGNDLLSQQVATSVNPGFQDQPDLELAQTHAYFFSSFPNQ